MRSATTGLRLCGIADEPFWPRPNGSSTSRTSVRARWRTSSAKASSEEARTARAVMSSACRSRCRIWVEVGAGSSPRRSQATRSTSGSIAAYWPTAPESFPTRQVSSAARSCVRRRSSSNAQPASLRPKVVGSAWTPWVRPMQSVSRCSRARATTAAKAWSSAVEHELSRGLELERQRRIDHVRRREAVVEPAPLLAELLGDCVDERGRVVVEHGLELGHARRVGRHGRRADPLDRLRPGRRRPRPSRRARRAPPPASAPASPRPTRRRPSPAASSEGSRADGIRAPRRPILIRGHQPRGAPTRDAQPRDAARGAALAGDAARAALPARPLRHPARRRRRVAARARRAGRAAAVAHARRAARAAGGRADRDDGVRRQRPREARPAAVLAAVAGRGGRDRPLARRPAGGAPRRGGAARRRGRRRVHRPRRRRRGRGRAALRAGAAARRGARLGRGARLRDERRPAPAAARLPAPARRSRLVRDDEREVARARRRARPRLRRLPAGDRVPAPRERGRRGRAGDADGAALAARPARRAGLPHARAASPGRDRCSSRAGPGPDRARSRPSR